MSSPCRLRGTIRRCPERSTASSPAAWQKNPRIASRTVTNSLLPFIPSRVRALDPQRPQPGSAFGGPSPADSATFGSLQRPVCCSLHLFQCPAPCALASQFPLPPKSIYRYRKCPPKSSRTHCQRSPKQHPGRTPRQTPFRKSLAGASFARQSLLPPERSGPAIYGTLKRFRLPISLHLRLRRLNRRPRQLPLPPSRSKLLRQSPKALWPSLQIANCFSPQNWRSPRRANPSISSAPFQTDHINSVWPFTKRIRACAWKKKVWRKFALTAPIPWPSTSIAMPSCSSAASSPWMSPGPPDRRPPPNARRLLQKLRL